MVSSDDLANDAEVEDIKEDVRLECSDYGQVLSVIIPRVRDGYPAVAEGHIFVEFSSPNGARDAAIALNGRKFDNKTVIVQYVSYFPIIYVPYFSLHSFFFSLMRTVTRVAIFIEQWYSIY